MVQTGEDPVLFTLSDGVKVRRIEFNEYVRFLSSDSQLGGEGGFFNPLNNGVLAFDIVQSGVGEALVERFDPQFAKEWATKITREKAFKPYQHPDAPFVSALQVWNYFAPEVRGALEEFQALESLEPIEMYKKKAALYVAERNFPPVYLRQVLAYQQKQFQWLEPDSALESKPLGLFGYSQLSDWFGISFIERSCEFIMQTAANARAQGFRVSQAEALASLYKNVKKASNRLQDGSSPEELLTRALRELNVDKSQAAKIWADVLLFRKTLIELPSRVVINTAPFDDYLRHQSQMTTFSCFQLQPSLRLQSQRDLMKFEVWKDAVSGSSTSLSLPSDFLTSTEVLASWPELVERPFILKVSSTSNAELTKKIRVRDLWNWEIEHWEELADEFSQLREKEVSSREEKFTLLDRLSPQIRSQVDDKARASILLSHPEWKDEALDIAEAKTLRVAIRAQGGKLPFEGISDRPALVQALLEGTSFSAYTQDNDHFYRIEVVERSKGERIVSLPDALEDGTLDLLLDRLLESAYGRMKSTVSEFRDDKGDYKPFREVKDRVGELHFASFFSLLDRSAQEWREKLPDFCRWEEEKVARVAVRFLPHLSFLEDYLKANDNPVCVTAVFESSSEDAVTLNERPLYDLWSLVVCDRRAVRYESNEKPQFAHLLSEKEGIWTAPRYSQELGPFVARVEKKDVESYDQQLRAAVYGCQDVLGGELMRERSKHLVKDLFGGENR